MMNSSTEGTPQEVAGASEQSAPKAKRRKYVPKHAIRLAGEVGLYRLCRGCDVTVTSDGTGRPKEYCDVCRKAVYAAAQRAYYSKNREALLKKLNEKRFKERQQRGSV